MALITFRIFFPSEFSRSLHPIDRVLTQLTLSNIAEKLKEVGVLMKNNKFLSILDDTSAPEIIGQEVAVEAEITCHTTYKAYCDLIQSWNAISQSYSVECRPMLVVAEKDAFIKSKVPHHLGVHCSELDFGTLPFAGSFVSYTKLLANGNGSPYSISIDFIHDEKRIVIKIHEVEEFWDLFPSYDEQLIVSYDNISKILVKHESHNLHFYLVLLHPPLLYHLQQKSARNGFRYETRKRVREIESLSADIIGRANVVCVSIARQQCAEIISHMHYRCNRLPVMFGFISDSSSSFPPDISDECFVHFSCRYMFTALMKRNFYIAEQLRTEARTLPFRSWFVSSGFTNEEFLEKSLTDIFFAVDAGHFVCFCSALSALYSHYETCMNNENFLHYIVPAKSRRIRRAIMTPTRMLLWPPEIMFENRVLRNFNSDFALRVNFREDDINRLSYNANFSEGAIFKYAISEPMTNGLKIGGRTYEFLGWSNSQIRDHGVWMYALDDRGMSIRDIRRWMGDFSHIHSVPKYMSRMGQAFSQTEDTVSVPLEPSRVRTEPDIERGWDPNGKPYCFSDGVGRISESLSAKVREALGHDLFCSAFQIRYGGYKGMLVTDPTLEDVDIVFRKSMKKFDSPGNTRLEIARTSAPVPLFLNRPFITILSQLGVRHNVFLRLQEEMLCTLTDMLIDETCAAKYLHSKLPFQAFDMNEIAECGIGLTTEPFFRSLLLALHRQNVYKVKSKANVAIDPSKGRNMLGVLDETGKLQYGQVFVQYTNSIEYGETRKAATVAKGTVLVTKNPCMHPGDVRKFQAVDVPELHHIIDCIVFPQNGHRPHPNEMAGSDLDGDEYAVLWHDDLIFKRPNETPADFPSYPGPEKFYISDLDIISFLVEYIRNDQVGSVANAHLAMAHNERDGIFSRRCKVLANKFSVAVDFPKTGSSSQYFHLERNERPVTYPDFMEKYWKITYRSKSALGKMFRVCKDFETENQYASLNYSNVQLDTALIVDGWEKYKEDAIKSRDKYYRLLRFILQNHGVQHESEAFSGAFTKLHCRYHERKDRAEIEKVIIARLKTLWKNMRKEFYEDFTANGVHDANEVPREALQKASAWYIVAYQSQNPVFLSFPWLVSNFLAKIKLKKFYPFLESVSSPLVLKLDDYIMMNVEHNQLSMLPAVAKDLFKSYDIICDEKVLVSAFDFIRLWAIDNGIIQGPSGRVRGFMYFTLLIKIFLFIANKEGYVKSRNELDSHPVTKASKYGGTAAALFLAFLRYCAKLNFCEKKASFEVLPFEVYKSKRLGKTAMLTFHNIAITGSYYCADHHIESNTLEMKPEYIECDDFLSELHDKNILKIEEVLQNYSEAESVIVKVKKTTKKLLITAHGTQQSINMLRTILSKGPEVIKCIIAHDSVEQNVCEEF